MPIDVVKVRLQMQGADGTKQFKGVFDAGIKTAQVSMTHLPLSGHHFTTTSQL